jgi:hypothetical protein
MFRYGRRRVCMGASSLVTLSARLTRRRARNSSSGLRERDYLGVAKRKDAYSWTGFSVDSQDNAVRNGAKEQIN